MALKDFVDRKISHRDPYVAKFNDTNQWNKFQPVHFGSQRTEDILTKMESPSINHDPYYKTIQDRYYKEQHPKQATLKTVAPEKQLTKHMQVRLDQCEKMRLDEIDAALRTSPRLCEVEHDSLQFEKATSKEFTKSINLDLNKLTIAPFAKRQSVTNSTPTSKFLVLSPSKMGVAVQPEHIKNMVKSRF